MSLSGVTRMYRNVGLFSFVLVTDDDPTFLCIPGDTDGVLHSIMSLELLIHRTSIK
jgi:hypothetical protein